MEHLTTTAYRLQASRQSENYNKTIVARLRHYVAERQRERELLVQQLAYTYNSEKQYTTGTSLFSLVLSFELPRPTTFVTPSALPTDINAETLLKAFLLRILSSIAYMRHSGDKQTIAAQQRYK